MSKEFFSSGGSHNTIAFGTTIKGDVSAEADLRIDGEIEGNITCNGKIVVGHKASVIGNITATSAEIIGSVKGNVKVHEALSLKATAQIHGDVEMHTLSVEPNAFLSGHCLMVDKKE